MNPKKQKRRQWHRAYRPFVFDYFKGICQMCQKEAGSIWDIHHYRYDYKGKLYDTNALELIENNIITLVCRPCHNIIHTATDPENPLHDKFHIHNRGNCEICGRNERGIFDRKKGMCLDKLMCRPCFLKFKNPQLMTQLELF